MLATREGELLFQDDFSDPSSGWATVVRAEGEARYAEGGYRIVVKQAGRQVWSDISGPRVEGLRLEFEVTPVVGTTGDVAGARCYTEIDSRVGYIVGVAPAERGYYVGAFRGDHYRLLESAGEAVDAVRPVGEENQLRVECIASRDGPTVLTLAVNGRALVRAEDESGRRGFDGFGLFVDTTEGGAEARFDDLVVTELVPGGQALSESSSLAQRLLQPAELADFAPGRPPEIFNSAEAWADTQVTAREVVRETARLRRLGFVVAVRRFFKRDVREDQALSYAVQLDSAAAARAELSHWYAGMKASIRPDQKFVPLAVPDIPGARGVDLSGPGHAGGHNIAFAEGPFFYFVGAAYGGSSERLRIREEIVAAAVTLYTRVGRLPSS